MTVKISAKASATEIQIYGDIGEFDDMASVDAEMIANGVKESHGRDIVMRIDSVGGSVFGGLGILSAMDSHEGKITAQIERFALSIASAIAAKADVVSIAKSGMMMIHGPHMKPPSSINAPKMRELAGVLDKFADAVSIAYQRKSGPAASVIDTWLKDGTDHYFTAAEAVELGLADSVVESPTDITARFALPERFRTPTAHAVYMKEEVMTDQAPAAVGNAAPDTTPAAPEMAATPEVSFMAQHKAASDSGEKAGIRKENRRQKDVRAQFYDANGRFAFGDEANPGDPMMSLMSDCIDDMACSETEALRRITAAFKDGYKPIPAPPQNQQLGESSLLMRDQDIPRFRAGQDGNDKLRDGMVMATLGRMGRDKVDYGNPWRGHTLLDLARDCLAKAGINPYGMSGGQIAKRVLSMQTTSDFPIILENTLHKLVLAGFESGTPQYPKFCKIGSVGDLRDWKRITPGLLSDLEEQDEGGDYRTKPIPDGEAESVSAQMIGNLITVTANVLINDDLNYIDSRARGIGMAGGRTVERKVWQLLAANPIMSDGNALFSAAHENLVDGTNAPAGDPSIDTVDQMAALMAEQTAPTAKDDPSPTVQYLDLEPYAAAAHRWRRSVLKVINNDTTNLVQAPGTAAATGLPFDGLVPNGNPMAGTFTSIATSVMAERLPWYMFANPDVAPIIEVVFLNGQREPQVSMEEDFNSSGLKWKVEYPHGVGAIGWRGAIKNPGE